MPTNQFQNLCDTWECLDYFQRANKANLTINQLNSFEEVKDFLASQIDQQEEQEKEFTNIDSIIDKLKGS